MTARKSALVRPFKPERVSRETMAYLLDMSPDTFDRLVADDRLPKARECAGIKRWDAAAVMRAFDGVLDVHTETMPADGDPFLKNIEAFRGKEARRGAA